jgi:hypothetical protein
MSVKTSHFLNSLFRFLVFILLCVHFHLPFRSVSPKRSQASQQLQYRSKVVVVSSSELVIQGVIVGSEQGLVRQIALFIGNCI